ncbi:MAG: DUF2164 family protein [Dehalococcoidia bacterium]|nr:DUF2164 family protein [Dehalococcoidia bacterium]
MTDFPMKFEAAQRREVARQFQHYLEREFGVEAGELAAGFLADFAGEVLGPLYYNAGLHDALDVARQHAETTTVDVLALEREVEQRSE